MAARPNNGRQRAALLASFFASTALASDVTAETTLRVATFDVSVGRADVPEVRAAEPAARPAFRHTFGSERRLPEQRRRIAADTTGLGADIVLLQGITDAAAVRRIFPAQDWKVVLSRQFAAMTPGESPVVGTGIAVRLSETFRVGRQDHLMGLAESPGRSAATAAAVRIDGRNVWILSLDLEASCSAGQSPCVVHPPHAAAIAAWLAERTKAGEPVVIGGVHASRIALPAPSATDRAPVAVARADRRPPTTKGRSDVAVRGDASGSSVESAEAAACPRTDRPSALVWPAVVAAASAWAVPLRAADDAQPDGCILAVDVTF